MSHGGMIRSTEYHEWTPAWEYLHPLSILLCTEVDDFLYTL